MLPCYNDFKTSVYISMDVVFKEMNRLCFYGRTESESNEYLERRGAPVSLEGHK